MKRAIFSLIAVVLFFLTTNQGLAVDLDSWPREIEVDSGSITIYQPQLESLQANILKGRAAIAFTGFGGKAPVFGVAWFTARVQIDRETRQVHYEKLEITDTRFPDGQKDLAEQFKKAVEGGMQGKNLQSSLDELTTALAAVGQEQEAGAKLKTTPPAIIYKEQPALLVTIDGPPVLQKVEGSSFQAVANTPYPLFFDGRENWYLNAAKGVWYRSPAVDGPYTTEATPPEALVQLVETKARENEQIKAVSDVPETAATETPLIVVVHNPSELIVSKGKASFKPLTDNLLAMENSDSDVFMDITSQHYFLVVSGRWYKAPSMEGEWQYVAADKLPASFAEIPEESRYADVRAYVAGTDEAKEAIMDAQIPQTAAVKREKVDIRVSYDGKPKFEKINGTGLAFAVNCSESVILAEKEKKYYLVKDGVWYISNSPAGIWEVSDHAPPGIGKVPPSSPVYNTKYVYVYDSSPEVVYVGYTPGYMGSYIYGPTIVYGTGWYYSPWISPVHYYPRPATWGFSVSYNPWTGWGFGLSWSSGPFRFGFYTGGGCHGPYWGRHWYGPGGYRPSLRQVNINNININRNNFNRNNFNDFSRHNNLYRNTNQHATINNTINKNALSAPDRQQIKDRVRTNREAGAGGDIKNRAVSLQGTGKEITKADIRNKAAAVNRGNVANNVFSDSKGNVLRNNNGQWQQHVNGQWKQPSRSPGVIGTGSRPSVGSGYSRPSSLDRDNFSRQRAMQRSQSYRSMGGHRPGGGGRLHR